MRIRKNSNPYDKFTPEQLVMGDKAESLGFVWDRTKYPTPAWAIDYLYLRNTEPLFGIPKYLWERELRLGSIDYIETLLPIWENWAAIYAPNFVDAARTGLNACRNFVLDKTTGSYAVSKAYLENYSIAQHAQTTFGAEGYEAGRVLMLSSGAYKLNESIEDIQAVEWFLAGSQEDDLIYSLLHQQQQRLQSLAQRIDIVAPWSLT